MATLTYKAGVTGSGDDGNFVRVGHFTSLTNDAVWSFVVSGGIATSVSFTFNWNDLEDEGGPGTGYIGKDPVTKVFAISSSSTAGRTAYSGTHIAKKTVSISGHSGTITLHFDDLSLAPGTYYIRANHNGNSTDTDLLTGKCFYQSVSADNTPKATYEVYYGIKVKVDGTWKTGTVFVKVNGTWVRGTPYIKVDDAWKKGTG